MEFSLGGIFAGWNFRGWNFRITLFICIFPIILLINFIFYVNIYTCIVIIFIALFCHGILMKTLLWPRGTWTFVSGVSQQTCWPLDHHTAKPELNNIGWIGETMLLRSGLDVSFLGMYDSIVASISVDWNQWRGVYKSPRDHIGYFNYVPWQNNTIMLIITIHKLRLIYKIYVQIITFKWGPGQQKLILIVIFIKFRWTDPLYKKV